MVEFLPSSWQKAGAAFDEAAGPVRRDLGHLIRETCDPGGCGAAGGLSTADAAIATVLSSFGEVMQSVAGEVADGLQSESRSMIATGKSYQATEEGNRARAGRAGGPV